MTIRTKLLLGFGAMIVAMGGLGGLAYYVCVTGSRSADQLSEMTTDVLVGSDLLEDLLMCRMHVKDYLIPNDQTNVEQYDRYRARIESSLRSCDESFQDPERRAWIADFGKKFNTYDWTFDEVKSTIVQRNTLITTQCDRLGAEMSTLLNTTAKDAAKDDAVDMRQHAMQSIRDLLQFRISVLKYIKTSEQLHFVNAKHTLADAQYHLTDAITAAKGTAYADAFLKSQRMLGDYASAFETIHTAQASNDLSDKADHLLSLVGQFKVNQSTEG